METANFEELTFRFLKYILPFKKYDISKDLYYLKKNCLLCIALLDMDDARGTFVTFKKLFNSCRHELEE